jgi:hypothetical protein
MIHLTNLRFIAGEHVFHPKFGSGLIVRFDGDKHLIVDFCRVGEKRVVPDFLTRSPAERNVNYPAEQVWTAGATTVCGGDTLWLNEDEAREYNADPDAYVAKDMG